MHDSYLRELGFGVTRCTEPHAESLLLGAWWYGRSEGCYDDAQPPEDNKLQHIQDEHPLRKLKGNVSQLSADIVDQEVGLRWWQVARCGCRHRCNFSSWFKIDQGLQMSSSTYAWMIDEG
mmetsp:Transcript_149799/g.272354  ORF Transcript_149799/g.272354 Transcript_149799/m.272354 type:complete len:120 (-) Transcript_149799:11-370(-)